MRDFDPTASEFITSDYLKNSRPGGLMYDPGTIMGGASILSSIIGSDAADRGMSAQSAAAARSDAINQQMYDQTRADNAPARARGEASGNRLADLLGLSGNTGAQGYGTLSQNFGEQAPTMQKFGQDAYNNDFVAQNGLQFGLDEGRKGVERQQQASGGLLSGATLKALTRFGNDYGTKNTAGAYDRFTGEQNRDYGQYTDRYNRNNTDNTNQFNRLSSVAGTGQAATNQVGAAGQNFANATSQTAQGLGNAQAAASIAGSNAWSGGLQSGINNYNQNRMLDMYQQRTNNNQRGNSGSGMATQNDPYQWQ